MKITEKLLSSLDIISESIPWIQEDMLFFDIETTGLSAKKSHIYCIGCGWRKQDDYWIRLYFAETPDEEMMILSHFFAFAAGYPTLVCFNGLGFDLPFLRQRAELLSLSDPPDDKTILDLHRITRKFKHLFSLPSCRQKNLEQFLGIERDDPYNGGELISVYQDFAATQDPDLEEMLLLHNLEDISGMFQLMSILSYQQFETGTFALNAISQDEGLIHFELIPQFPLPQPVHCQVDEIHIHMKKNKIWITLPIRHGELKYFFSDAENYYYLPQEDTIVHKSIGEFVDKKFRRKATKKNCFLKKECSYIVFPVQTNINGLKTDVSDKHTYLELVQCTADFDTLKYILIQFFKQCI